VSFEYYVGLDLGQVNDWTALAVLQEPVWVDEPPWADPEALWPADRRGWTSALDLAPSQARHFRARTAAGHRPGKPPLSLRHLERMRHLSYVNVVDKLAALLGRWPLAGADVALLVDHGGVGRGVYDLLVQAGLRPIGITITGGNEVHGDAATALTVPKRDLITATQVMLQGGRLRIAAGLEHAPVLVKELLDYRVKISPAGHDSYDAREGQHDDTVLATALGCWYRDWINFYTDAQLEARASSAR
jgi:hypothetical protein